MSNYTTITFSGSFAPTAAATVQLFQNQSKFTYVTISGTPTF